MRLLKIGVYYSKYLEQFYSRFLDLADQSYSTQHSALIDDCFGSSNFWTRALQTLGYETCDLIANAEPLQKQWAAEQNVLFDPDNWLFDITAAQIRDFQPDVLIVADYSTVTASFLRRIKDECQSIKLILGWCGAPYHDGSIFNECDIVLSCVPELVKHFQQNGRRSAHVNHAFEARILKKLTARYTQITDFAFVGSIFKAEQFHIERERVLAKLVRETSLQIWSDVSEPPSEMRTPTTSRFGSLLQRASRYFSSPVSDSPWVDHEIWRRSKPPLFGLDMFQQLHDSRVALNTHIDISPVNASNMRLFEATGVGSCLLTDWKSNLSTLFEVDSEVVTYRNADECIEKVKYLLRHEKERNNIASAGQRRTLRDHTFENRAARINEIVREALA